MAAQAGKRGVFYKISGIPEKESSIFFDEFNILSKTIDSVNNLRLLYKTGRTGARGGPSTHDQQDLYRAMLVFACAGLDVFVKQLVKNKLPDLLEVDMVVQGEFKEYVRKGALKDKEKMINIVALALIDQAPRSVFLSEYMKRLTGDSLQSVSQLLQIAKASGLEKEKIYTEIKNNAIKEAFEVRNQIVHEMDINVIKDSSRNTGFRTRRQRRAPIMEKHAKSILKLAEGLLLAYKEKFYMYQIGVVKGR